MTVYADQPEATIRFRRLSNRLGWLLGGYPVQPALHGLVDRFVDGPSEAARRAESMYVWRRATNGEESVVSRLVTPESYLFTSHSAPHLATHIHDGETPVGFQTPSSAFGPDVALNVDDVERTDE